MPVVEITQLRLKGMTADDPMLLESLSLVRSRLQTSSRFFSCIADTSLIYIFGFWESLDAHLQFLASPARDEILGPQEKILDFHWTIHLNLNTISPSFLDAPFLAVQRLEFDADHVDIYDSRIAEHARNLQIATAVNVLYGRRCDGHAESPEAAILTTWDVEGSIDPNRRGQIALDGDDKGLCRSILFHCAQNMETSHTGA